MNQPPTATSPAAPPTLPTTALLVGTTTVSERADADRLARGLVENRLAACVQIDGPITSVYSWQDKLETAPEFRLTVKFPAANAAALETWLRANHPYDTPEWIATPACFVSDKYLSWALANCSVPA